jgi:hypothetical protein
MADRRLLLSLAIAVPLIEAGLRSLGFKRMYQVLHRLARGTPPSRASSRREVNRHQRLLRLVCRYSPLTGRCLARSLALWWFLRRQGINTDLRIGTRKQGGHIEGHAWIEYQNVVVNDSAEVRAQYVPFARKFEVAHQPPETKTTLGAD